MVGAGGALAGPIEDITKAEDACLMKGLRKSAEIVECQANGARPIFARSFPEKLPVFEAYVIRRTVIARDYDARRISSAESSRRMTEAGKDLAVQLTGLVAADWRSQPTLEQVAAFYPQQAIIAGVPGRVILACRVTVGGQMDGCAVVSETPPSYGFGAAAIRLSRFFEMTPATRDNQPIESEVRVPVNFNLPKNWLQRLADQLAK